MMWVFPKIGVGPPNHPMFNRVFHEINPSILGEKPLFLVQHPCDDLPCLIKNDSCLD